MRLFYFIILFIFTFSSVAYSKDKKILQGNFTSGTALNFARSLSSNTSETDKMNLRVRFDINYFLIDKLSLGPVLIYNLEETSITKSDEFIYGINLSYFFYELEDWAFLAGLYYLVATQAKTHSLSPYLGAQYFVNESISFGPQLRYTNLKDNHGQGRDEINLFIGFNYYL